MNIIRQWRNIKLAKRQGKGHDPKGIESTAEGELAVLCRSCPHPGVNLPRGWDKAPRTIACVIDGPLTIRASLSFLFSFIYTLFLCMDANFRQKNRYRATTYEDVSLSDGWAYFVKTEEYMNHISKYASQEEVCFRYYCITNDMQRFCLD